MKIIWQWHIDIFNWCSIYICTRKRLFNGFFKLPFASCSAEYADSLDQKDYCWRGTHCCTTCPHFVSIITEPHNWDSWLWISPIWLINKFMKQNIFNIFYERLVNLYGLYFPGNYLWGITRYTTLYDTSSYSTWSTLFKDLDLLSM